MSSTLTKIMETDTPSMASAAVRAPVSAPASASWFSTPVIILLSVIVIVGIVLFFLPTALNYLSLPEQVIEEEVKKEVDKVKAKKQSKEKEIVDKAGVLEKQGFCYIGTDRGIRSCIDVIPGDKCMSGQIFPRMDICVNPSLRL